MIESARAIDLSGSDINILKSLFERVDCLVDESDAHTITGFGLASVKAFGVQVQNITRLNLTEDKVPYEFAAADFSLIMGVFSAVFASHDRSSALKLLQCSNEELSAFERKFSW